MLMEKRCNSCAYLVEQDGEWFCEDWEKFCKDVDDGMCEVTKNNTIVHSYNAIRDEIESKTRRSAWDKGVTDYAIDMLDRLFDDILDGYIDYEDIMSPKLLERALLNGAPNWDDYSWGGCSLIYDQDIAERLCTPSELKKTKNGQRKPNKHEQWLDTQARALYQASIKVINAVKKTKGECYA